MSAPRRLTAAGAGAAPCGTRRRGRSARTYALAQREPRGEGPRPDPPGSPGAIPCGGRRWRDARQPPAAGRGPGEGAGDGSPLAFPTARRAAGRRGAPPARRGAAARGAGGGEGGVPPGRAPSPAGPTGSPALPGRSGERRGGSGGLPPPRAGQRPGRRPRAVPPLTGRCGAASSPGRRAPWCRAGQAPPPPPPQAPALAARARPRRRSPPGSARRSQSAPPPPAAPRPARPMGARGGGGRGGPQRGAAALRCGERPRCVCVCVCVCPSVCLPACLLPSLPRGATQHPGGGGTGYVKGPRAGLAVWRHGGHPLLPGTADDRSLADRPPGCGRTRLVPAATARSRRAEMARAGYRAHLAGKPRRRNRSPAAGTGSSCPLERGAASLLPSAP